MGKFFEQGIYTDITNKVGASTIGLYDQYENDANGAYDITVCTEVGKVDMVPMGCVVKHIPAGKYAKFKVKGQVQEAVARFWMELWKMNLRRSYKGDFEEYVGGTPEACEIDIYIAL